MRFCTLHRYRPHGDAVGHVILIVEEWAKRLQTIIPMYTQAHFFPQIIQLFFRSAKSFHVYRYNNKHAYRHNNVCMSVDSGIENSELKSAEWQ